MGQNLELFIFHDGSPQPNLVDVEKEVTDDLSKELTDLLISVYRKANIQFEPGQNLSSNKAIREKIEKVWKDAVFVAN